MHRTLVIHLRIYFLLILRKSLSKEEERKYELALSITLQSSSNFAFLISRLLSCDDTRFIRPDLCAYIGVNLFSLRLHHQTTLRAETSNLTQAVLFSRHNFALH